MFTTIETPTDPLRSLLWLRQLTIWREAHKSALAIIDGASVEAFGLLEANPETLPVLFGLIHLFSPDRLFRSNTILSFRLFRISDKWYLLANNSSDNNAKINSLTKVAQTPGAAII
jgi:hypothetical protein